MEIKINDTNAIRCSICNIVYGSLAHINLYGKRICNKCCPTSRFSKAKTGEVQIFLGCDCKRSKNV